MARLVPASDAGLLEAARRLRAGEPVAFPTETVYGLGAGTFDPAGLERIFTLKGRPDDNPLIAHVRDAAEAARVAEGWDERAARLAERCWPGPLTLVLPRAEGVPPRATAGWPTIAVRAPKHPVARALLEAYGEPISAPSANRSGRVSPTRPEHVVADYEGVELLVLDGGPCAIGIESTVLDLTADPAVVLRPGAVSLEVLRDLLGDVDVARFSAQAASPGTARRHYAPRTTAVLVERAALAERLAGAAPVAVLRQPGVPVPAPHRAVEMPEDAAGYAARLYDALREADELGVEEILVVEPAGRDGLWLAVWDRLLRATT